MAQTLAAVFTVTDRYTTALEKIMKSQDSFEKKQSQIDRATQSFNKQLSDIKGGASAGAAGISSITGKLTGLISAAYLGKKALEGMFSAINTAAIQKMQETTFQALLKNEQAGSALYDYVGAYAESSALGREDLAKGVTSFLSVTRDIDQIEQLIKMTERLYAKDPTQGAEGAVFALKEALSGDVMSLRERFGISGLSGEALRSGDTASKIEQLDAALNQFGATQEVVDKNFTGLLTQTNLFTSNMQTAIGEAATPVMENLSLVMQKLNADMDAGKFQPFIALMVNGMEMIGNGIVWVGNNLNWLAPIVIGLCSALVIYKGYLMAVDTWQKIVAISSGIMEGRWLKAGAALAAVAGSAALVATLTKDIDEQTDASLADLKEKAGENLSTTAQIDANVVNSDPIKVTGEVDIEKESLKYMLDLAGMKYFAKFSNATLAPQVNIYGQTIEKTADADEVISYVAQGLADASAAAPEGVY